MDFRNVDIFSKQISQPSENSKVLIKFGIHNLPRQMLSANCIVWKNVNLNLAPSRCYLLIDHEQMDAKKRRFEFSFFGTRCIK